MKTQNSSKNTSAKNSKNIITKESINKKIPQNHKINSKKSNLFLDLQNLQSTTEEFAKTYLAPFTKDVDKNGEFPTRAFDAMRECGFLGLFVPKNYGGLGGTLDDYVKICYIFAKYCPTTALCFTMHNGGVNAIAHFSSEAMKDEFLPKIARGEIVIATAYRESTSYFNIGMTEKMAYKNMETGEIWEVDSEDSKNLDCPGDKNLNCTNTKKLNYTGENLNRTDGGEDLGGENKMNKSQDSLLDSLLLPTRRPINKGDFKNLHSKQATFNAKNKDENLTLGVILKGEKSFVTSSCYADFFLTYTNSCNVKDARNNWLVPSNLKNLTIKSDTWDGLGMRGNNSASVKYDDVWVDYKYLIGQDGTGGMQTDFTMIFGILGFAAVYSGLGRAAFECILNHTKNRKYANGECIADSELVRLQLADLHVKVSSQYALTMQAVKSYENNDADAIPLAFAARLNATQNVIDICTLAMKLGGGIAYNKGLQLERYLRDSFASLVMSPTPDMLRKWLGDEIVK